jgi:serine/threonine-protein kinase HipA
MARNLDVYLNQDLVGDLTQDEHGNLGFQYASSWLQNPKAKPLSQSLPLKTDGFDRNECQGFFGGILPEADQRDTIARNLGISKKNDFAMLEQIGGECAGAVTFMPPGEPLPEAKHSYHPLDDKTLAETLRKLPARPLLAGEDGIRLSLAGAQVKLAVHKSQTGKLSIPLGGAPSTHIIKPAVRGYEGIVANEAFCMRLAQAVKLKTANVETGHVEGIDFLLVERYDRKTDANQTIRLHQEDFCQALGKDSNLKYQNEGGPSLKDCFDLLRATSSFQIRDLQALLDAVLFNVLIGNNDAHAKNFSLLYDQGVALAPLYDLICTVAYPDLASKMAMKIGSKYEFDQVLPRHFEAMAEEAGLSKAIVRRRVGELAQTVLDTLETVDSAPPNVIAIITSRCLQTLHRLTLQPE